MIKKSSSSPRGISACRVWLTVCLFTFFVQAVHGQSSEEVHLSPRITAAPAASAGASPLHPKPLRYDVDLVLVPVTVTDSYNRLVTGLEKQDFRLFEGETPQEIRYFSSEDGPISLGVILDLSKSMRDKIDSAREAAVRFFENSNPADDYFVITFADRPQLLADSTRSVGFIREKLATTEPDGFTALLDAIYLGINKMRSAKHGRRALLVISDGGDNNSRYTEKELKRLVEEADVEIYAIGIFSRFFKTPEEWHGRKLLTDITEATGGRMITLHSPKELPEIAATLSLELRSQYVLGYRPSNENRDGQWRKIKVSLASSDSVQPRRVYSKKGYLGPGQ